MSAVVDVVGILFRGFVFPTHGRAVDTILCRIFRVRLENVFAGDVWIVCEFGDFAERDGRESVLWGSQRAASKIK